MVRQCIYERTNPLNPLHPKPLLLETLNKKFSFDTIISFLYIFLQCTLCSSRAGLVIQMVNSPKCCRTNSSNITSSVVIQSPFFPFNRGILFVLRLAPVVKWKYVVFLSPFWSQFALARCFQYNSSCFHRSLIQFLTSFSSVWTDSSWFDWARSLNLSFAFLSSTLLLLNFVILHIIRWRPLFVNLGSTLPTESLSLLSVQAFRIIPSQSGFSIYISSNLKLRFLFRLSPFMRRTSGE